MSPPADLENLSPAKLKTLVITLVRMFQERFTTDRYLSQVHRILQAPV